VGIGINTTSTPADVPEALALSELKAGNVWRDDLFLQLARELLEMHSGFMVEGFSRFRATWTARSAFVVKKTRISIDLGGEVVSGLYAGISDSGALRIMDASLVDSVTVASEAERGEREIHSGHIVHWERFYGEGHTYSESHKD
jgi:biotin-(acetyl-CoA carboxylase) ligase